MSEDSAIAIDDGAVDAPIVSATDNGALAPIAPISHVALPAGVSEIDFEAALAIGREKGRLTQGELIEALHAVELTPEVLMLLLDRVTSEGVVLVVEEEEELAVEAVTPSRKEPRPRGPTGASGPRLDARPPGATGSGCPLRARTPGVAPRTPSTRT